ncbi:unnamed protein product [Oikopleura dioica]|uniref:Uncharacterized protein n=1 Tax=Oikopleura dioica TaxID=34765 RepID=E4YT50_OIKDI|nr:unnamed protein product [Oikopleura dioica]
MSFSVGRKEVPLAHPAPMVALMKCLQECTENRLEDLYSYNRYRAIQVREYWANKGHNQ